MTLRFQLLGTITICGKDGTAKPKGSHVGGLLASLLMASGATVTHTQLQLDLWRRPPTSATDNLRKFAMRLRRQLEDLDGGSHPRIETHPSGYALDARSDELDVREFRQLWSAARTALRAGDFERAHRLLTEGTGLWRGLAGLDTPQEGLLSSRLHGLNQEYLSAIEDLAAARVAVGDSIGTHSTLEELLAEHPGRERGWQLLLVARYRAGDLVGALETYRRCRTYLTTEFGLEPARSLQLLQQAVLNRDDHLLFDNHLLFDTTDVQTPAPA